MFASQSHLMHIFSVSFPTVSFRFHASLSLFHSLRDFHFDYLLLQFHLCHQLFELLPLSQKIAFEKLSLFSSFSVNKQFRSNEKKAIDRTKEGERKNTHKEINTAAHFLLSYFSFESNWLLLKKRERYSIIFLLHERI